eukprot:jgi/Psemu1/18074/gm1.18074_g
MTRRRYRPKYWKSKEIEEGITNCKRDDKQQFPDVMRDDDRVVESFTASSEAKERFIEAKNELCYTETWQNLNSGIGIRYSDYVRSDNKYLVLIKRRNMLNIQYFAHVMRNFPNI